MSQFFISNGGSTAPDIETLTGNSGGAVGPDASFNINILGDDSTTNNINGITVVGTPASNLLTVTLTNRITGSGQTTDDITPVTIYTFPMGATPGTYLFFTKIVAFNLTDSLSAGYSSFRVNRTDGAVATNIGATTAFATEEGTMVGISVVNDVSGNDAILTVTGIAGKTINYFAVTEYILVS